MPSPFRPIYETVRREIEDAGFYVTGMPMDSGGDRIVCAGQKSRKGLSGNSFWVAERNGHWYTGTWGGNLYRIPQQNQVAALCISWLKRNFDEALGDFDEQFKVEYRLVAVDDLEVDSR